MLVYFVLGNAKFGRRVHCPTPTPNARYFAFWWNIGSRVWYGCVSGGGGLLCRGVKYEGTKQQDDGHMGQLIKTQHFMIIRNRFNQADMGIGRLYS